MDAPRSDSSDGNAPAGSDAQQQATPPGATRAANTWIPRRLTPDQRRRLVNALAKAFDHGGMERLASLGLGVTLGEIVNPNQRIQQIALELVEWAEAQNMLTELDSAAKADIPGNLLLQNWLPNPTFVQDSPYRGLSPFLADDADVFFGRDVFADQLEKAVELRPVVPVIGPSGSGKSSVVFAGLTPRLRAAGGWVIASFRPGTHPDPPGGPPNPFLALAATLVPLQEPNMSMKDLRRERREQAKEFLTGETWLHDVLNDIREIRNTPHLLLIADQFEEIFSPVIDDAVRRTFLDVLLAPFRRTSDHPGQAPPLVLVPTLRADYLGQSLSYPPLLEAMQGSDLKLGPMSSDELRQAIMRPAALRGVALQEGLTERILEDVGDEPGNLPLLEFALTRLWEEQEDGLLTHKAYEEIGEVEGALASFAEKSVSELGEDPERMRQVFTQLVRPGEEGTTDTRRQASREELGEEGWALVTRLADQKLVVTDSDKETGRDTVEVVHEALIREWPSLRDWMDLDRDFRRWQDRLRQDLQDWEEAKRDHGALLQGTRLDVANEWKRQRGAKLSEAECGFIEESVRAREDEQKSERLRRRRVIAGLAGGLVVALMLTVLSVWLWQQAEAQTALVLRQARINLIQALSSEATDQIQRGDHERGALLARQAYLFSSRAGNDALGVHAQIDSALRGTLGVEHFSRILRTGAAMNAVAFSADGALVAAGDRRGTVHLWDPRRPEAGSRLLPTRDDWVNAVAFNPRANMLATGGRAGAVRLWDLDGSDGDPVVLTDAPSSVATVAFSADGQLLAAGGSGPGPLRVWDLAQPNSRPAILSDASRDVLSVSFGREGRTLATTDQDGVTRLWDLTQPNLEPRVLHTAEANAASVAFSPDGRMIAMGSTDGTVQLWDQLRIDSPPEELLQGLGTAVVLTAVAVSPNNRMVAAVSGVDGHVWLWDRDAPDAPITLRGHESIVTSVAFSPDGQTLASAGGDETVRLWDLGEPAVPTLLKGHTDSIYAVAMDPDGRNLASADGDGAVRLWDLQDPQNAPRPLREAGSRISSLAFSRDRSKLAAGGYSDAVWIWDLNNPEGEPVKLQRPGGVTSVEFSPDGGTLAAGSWDGTATLWNLGQDVNPTELSDGLGSIQAVAFGAEGRILATAGCVRPGDAPGNCDEGGVRLWDLSQTAAPPRVLDDFADEVTSIAIAGDGRRMAVGSKDGAVRIWDLESLDQPAYTPTGPRFSVASVALSADGRFLAAGHRNGGLSVWDLNYPSSPAELAGHDGYVYALAFSPEGWPLASGGADSIIRLWTSTDTLAQTVCDRVGRNLDPEEWSQYIGAATQYEATCPNLPSGGNHLTTPDSGSP
jgi:WD40 repeat protein